MQKKKPSNPKKKIPNKQSHSDKNSDRKKNLSEKSAEEKTDTNLPGYPHYPPEADIMHTSSNVERVNINLDNFTRTTPVSKGNLQNELETNTGSDMELPKPRDLEDDKGALEIVPRTESDVTEEDLILLGEKDQDMDLGEDEEFKNTAWALDSTGEDLDIPGSEADDANENIGEEDEENNYYSLGGDRKED